MYKLLEDYMEKNTLVALYTNKDNYEAFAVGYINKIINDKVIILHIGVHGEFDGYSSCYVEDIYRVETNSKYIMKLSKLKGWDIPDVPKVNYNEDCFDSLIVSAYKNNEIIAIRCCDSETDIRGYIINYSDLSMTILQINEYGEDDGQTTIYTNDISKVAIMDVECKEIDKLYHIGKV